MYAAFYKGTRPGWQGIYSRLVRWWGRGPYSHVELVFAGDIAASASFIDGGVRLKQIQFDPDHWDFIDLPDALEDDARRWFVDRIGEKYDIAGNIRFIFPPMRDGRRKWFCSEAIAAALKIPDPWRYEPNVLASTLRIYTHPASAGFLF